MLAYDCCASGTPSQAPGSMKNSCTRTFDGRRAARSGATQAGSGASP
jgi:hypothetical protein